MNFSGLTDLPEGAAQDCARCRCGSLARVASGLCVSCLLRSGLASDEANIEDFDALLAAVDVPDRDWQLGNYRILEEIGRGGMGVIYRARHAPSRRIVALKRVLNYHSDSRETLARFQREARAAASLDHPNILPIYDVGATDDGLPFFSMKLASGGSFYARGRCLQSRRNFVRTTERTTAVPGRTRPCRNSPGVRKDRTEIALARPETRSRPGDNLRAVSGTRSGDALSHCWRPGGRSRTLARRPPYYRAPCLATRSGMALVKTQSKTGRKCRGVLDPCRGRPHREDHKRSFVVETAKRRNRTALSCSHTVR